MNCVERGIDRGARPQGLLEKSHLNTVASAPGTGHKNIKKRLQPLRLQPFCSIIKARPKMKTTWMNYTPIQLKLPVDMERIIEINDSVYTFNEVVSHIDLKKYFVEKGYKATGRPRYEREKLLKVLLFAFMEQGYPSLREIEKLCKMDIRFIWLRDEMKAPSYATLCDFINQELRCSLEEIVQEINSYIFNKEHVDLEHVYIDGTKIEANANT